METAPKNQPVPERDSAAVGRVREALRGLRYGEVRIVVHDGSVVQVERTEKLRFVNASESTRPGREAR